jgi:hypothetical protein
MSAWNAWYHCTAQTYGTWLRGDPRGWRTRHHREHVEGDYRHRPEKGSFEQLQAMSRRLMKRDPFKLAIEFRQLLVDTVARELESFECSVVIVSMDAVHMHLLAKFPDQNPRKWVAIAKKRSTQALKAHCSAVGFELGLEVGEGIWGKRSKAIPIESRSHQLAVIPYIARHADKGGALWVMETLRGKKLY